VLVRPVSITLTSVGINCVKFNSLCHKLFSINRQHGLFYSGNDVDGRTILMWVFRMLEGVVGTIWNWLRIGTGGGHLWVR
jgi:hypothetical protein